MNVALQLVFEPDFHAKILTYIYDFLIFNRNFEEHMATQREIFSKLMAAGVTLNIEKCCFFSSQMDFLGITVAPNGIIQDESRIQPIKDLSR